jgi:succinoglycan biosynthesis transport protein ExoP
MKSLEHELSGVAPARSERDEETLDLVRYWRAVARNKWRLLALVAAVAVLASLVASSLPPVYRGTSSLLIESSKPKFVSIEDVYGASALSGREYLQTQIEIIKSRELLAKVVSRLMLADHPLYDPRKQPAPFWAEWFPDGFLGEASATRAFDRASVEQGIVGTLLVGLNVQLVRGSQLIRISFESPDAGLAARVPNALAEMFIESDIEARLGMTRKAMSYLSTQIDDLRVKLGESERALQKFREDEHLIDTKGLAQSGATKQIEDLMRALSDSRAKRVDAENSYRQVSAAAKSRAPNALDAVPAIQRHPLISRLKELEGDAEKRINEFAQRYGPEHPKMIAARADLAGARRNVREQEALVARLVMQEYETAKANENSLEHALNDARGNVEHINRKEFQLAALERDVQTNRQLYDMFMQRLKETNLTGEMQTPLARVVDPALEPRSPAGPNKQRIVTLAALAALLLGISLALLIERLDSTIKTSQDVEAKLGLPALGFLQRVKPAKGATVERFVLDEPQAGFAESIRTIRSGVMLSALDAPRKIVLVTSSIPDEGKTTLAMNLAFALGQIKKTLLIEGDMRRPRIATALGIDREHLGLSELCAGTAVIDACVCAVENTPLHVLAAGRIPPNPQELLASRRFADTLRQLSERFEIIVIDTPPVQLVSDALMLSQLVTGVVYVVKADRTPFPLARRAVRKLQRAGAPIIGAVLNQIDVVKADKYYGEYSGYGDRHSKYNKEGYGYTAKS